MMPLEPRGPERVRDLPEVTQQVKARTKTVIQAPPTMTTDLSASSITLLHRGQQDLHFQPSEGLFTGPEPGPGLEAAVRLLIPGGGLDGTNLTDSIIQMRKLRLREEQCWLQAFWQVSSEKPGFPAPGQGHLPLTPSKSSLPLVLGRRWPGIWGL